MLAGYFGFIAATARRRPLLTIFVTMVTVRIAVFLFSIAYPIAGQGGHLVSPGLVNHTTDMVQYLDTYDLYFKTNHLVENFAYFYSGGYNDSLNDYGWIALAPALPVLIEFLGYKDYSPYPLSIFVLIAGIIFSYSWIIWLRIEKTPLIPLYVFSILPNTIWYSMNVSTDMLFASLSSLIFVMYFLHGVTYRNILIYLLISVAAMAMRPVSISIFFVFFLIKLLDFFQNKLEKGIIYLTLSIGVLLSSISILYYLPYFKFFSLLTPDFQIFGTYVSAFKAGLFPQFPEIIDQLFSRSLLVGSKLLSLVGIRQSYSGVHWSLIALRGATGLITLPGLLYLLWSGQIRHRVIVACMLGPVIIGFPLERYVLPVLPILFFYGVKVYAILWQRVTGRPAWPSMQ